MSLLELMPSIVTGLTVSVLHAALPTHWLPFVLASRAQKWNYWRTLSILFIAGIGHVVTTTVIGAGVIWFGINYHSVFSSGFYWVMVISVGLVGFFNVIQHFRGAKHSHCDHTHPHSHDHEFKKTSKDGWAILSLLSLLTFSPCESFIPVYVAAWPTGWFGFSILSLVLAVGTLGAMMAFMSIMYYGSKKINLHWLERHERLLIGLVLIVLSVMIYMTEIQFPHAHS
ncbi:MAG: sulfite exporter TauE/SafE family protein [Pseudobdellovibrio sp.]